jgi:hypothetical protein
VGFGATILACLLLAPTMALLVVFRDEAPRPAAGTAAAAAVSGGATFTGAVGSGESLLTCCCFWWWWGGGVRTPGRAHKPPFSAPTAPQPAATCADAATAGTTAGPKAPFFPTESADIASPPHAVYGGGGGVATTTPPGFHRVSVVGAGAPTAAAHARGPSVGVHGTHVPAPLPPTAAADAPPGTGEGGTV